MDKSKLYNYLDRGIEIIITGDIIPLTKELGTTGIVDEDCINIYRVGEEQTLTYLIHRKRRIFKYMNEISFMKDSKYILINLLTKDRLKLQAMMSLGFSFEDSLYELYIKDKEPVLHSYN